MKKIMFILIGAIVLGSCIKVVFEPYWGVSKDKETPKLQEVEKYRRET